VQLGYNVAVHTQTIQIVQYDMTSRTFIDDAMAANYILCFYLLSVKGIIKDLTQLNVQLFFCDTPRPSLAHPF